MIKNIELKSTDYTFSVKPNRLSIKPIGEITNDTVTVYYELIYDHFEDENIPIPLPPVEPGLILDMETNTPIPNPNYTGIIPEQEYEIKKVFKRSTVLYTGNEVIPATFLIPLLSGDVNTTNQILAGFEWSGLFDGFKMELAEK